jgi:hypothetical protein
MRPASRSWTAASALPPATRGTGKPESPQSGQRARTTDAGRDDRATRGSEAIDPLERRFATKLTTCSLCLRVQRGKNWVEAEHVIHELR